MTNITIVILENLDDNSTPFMMMIAMTIQTMTLRWRSRGEVEKSQRREEAAVKTVRASKQVSLAA